MHISETRPDPGGIRHPAEIERLGLGMTTGCREGIFFRLASAFSGSWEIDVWNADGGALSERRNRCDWVFLSLSLN